MNQANLFTRRCQNGFSMLEVIISSMLIGVVLVAALDSVGSAVLATQLRSEQMDATVLCNGLLAEAMAMPYEDTDSTAPVDFGAESDEPAVAGARTSFDDLDDYDGWTSSPPVNRDGTAVDGATGWTRTVAVEKIRWNDPDWTLGYGQADEGVRRISVTVTSPTGDATRFRAIRSSSGALQQSPSVDTTAVTSVSVTLHAGSAEPVTSCTSLLNHAQGP